jgi:hypothetical protein
MVKVMLDMPKCSNRQSGAESANKESSLVMHGSAVDDMCRIKSDMAEISIIIGVMLQCSIDIATRRVSDVEQRVDISFNAC